MLYWDKLLTANRFREITSVKKTASDTVINPIVKKYISINVYGGFH